MSTALVTNKDVQGLIGDTSVDMTPFINAAHIIIDEDLNGAALSAARKKQVELFLAAHFYVVVREKGGITREVIGDAEERYQVMPPSALGGLSTTRYGQQAIALDTTGKLGASATNPIKAQFRVV